MKDATIAQGSPGEWTATQAMHIDQVLDGGRTFLRLLIHRIDQLTDWTETRARTVVAGLGTARDLLGRVNDSMRDARCRTDERASKTESTLDSAREVVVKIEFLVGDLTGTLALELRAGSALVHEQIARLETSLEEPGESAWPAAIRPTRRRSARRR